MPGVIANLIGRDPGCKTTGSRIDVTRRENPMGAVIVI